MTTSVISTGYGRPALDELRSVVGRVKAEDTLAPVTVLVPNQVASVVARRHLARGVSDEASGIAGLYLSTIDRLAEQLAAPLLAPRRPATRPILAAAWRSALAEQPGMFAQISEHQSTVTALLAVHRELRTLEPGQLDEVAAGTRLAGEVVRLHRAVLARMRDHFYDQSDLLRRATRAVGDDALVGDGLGSVVLYLPEALDRTQENLIAALGDVVPLTVIAGRTGLPRPDRATLTSLRRFTTLDQQAPPVVPTASRVLHASDSDDEVRYVVRELLSDLQAAPSHRLAVLYANASPYARLLHEHLTAAGIRHNGSGSRPTLERSIPQGVVRLLDALLRDLPRATFFEALSAARIQLPDGASAPVISWERISRLAGVVSGQDWDHRLLQYAEREGRRADEERRADDPYLSRIERCERNADGANALREFALSLRSAASAGSDLGWDELSDRGLELFHSLFGEPDDLLTLPPEERNAARDVELALRSVASLVAFEPGAPGLDALLDVLTAELEGAMPRVGRFGEGVFVGPVSAAVGLDLDIVYVVGLSEDQYPGSLHPEPLVGEPLRQASSGALVTQRDRIDTLQRHLLAAFQCAPEVIACFPRGNLRRSQPRLPSRWLMPTLRELTGDYDLVASKWDTVSAPTIIDSPSYATELEQTSLPATEQEWRMRAFRAQTAEVDPIVSAATIMITERSEPSLTRFDGLVTDQHLPDYADGEQAISPTRLEEYASCPHSFFVRRLLNVEPVEHPEEIITISPLEIGTLMHEAMDAMITESTDQLPGFGEPWSPIHHRRLHEHGVRLAAQVEQGGLTGHPRLWRAERARILRDLDRMLLEDDRWRAEHDAEVLASELVFGMDGRPPVRLDLREGMVLLKGKADKIDRTRDGVILVTDIKTGSSSSYKGLEKDPVMEGTKLQLPAYAQAALDDFGGTEARAEYWFVRRDKDHLGVDLTPANLERYRDAIEILTTSICLGWFPAKPPASDYGRQCEFCSPDGIPPEALRRRWTLKRHDVEIERLVSLIDPRAVQGVSA